MHAVRTQGVGIEFSPAAKKTNQGLDRLKTRCAAGTARSEPERLGSQLHCDSWYETTHKFVAWAECHKRVSFRTSRDRSCDPSHCGSPLHEGGTTAELEG